MKEEIITFRLTPDESSLLLSSLNSNQIRFKRLGVDKSNPLLFSRYCNLYEKLADVVRKNKFRVLLVSI